ncbi:MAG: glycosyltransferase family 2 protein [Candidatus Omnitrophota bacterium]
MKKVSVVMLSYNRKKDVAEGVEALLKQDYANIEIIVVDNGSTDGTAQMVQHQYTGRVNLIALEENLGVAAYNIGFNQAEGEYIVILDDDSFPEKKAISRMVEEFEKNEELGIVAFDVRNYHDYQNCQTLANGPPTTNRVFSRYQLAFNGAGVGIRKTCIREVGGYPEEFFLYWNEQDLSIRVLDAGYKIQWFPDIISLHKYSPSNRESWRAPFYYTRNLYWLIWKYFPIKKVIFNTLQLIYFALYNILDQRTLVYLKATAAAFFNFYKIKRKPAKQEVIRNLRLTYRLAFIYYR